MLEMLISILLRYLFEVDHSLTIVDSGLSSVGLRIKLIDEFGVLVLVDSTRNPSKRMIRILGYLRDCAM
jgi:hypothetical protein